MSRPLILFAPGAGASSASLWMQAWRTRLAAVGDVAAFDYPYMLAGRRSPDPLLKLVAAHREALAQARGAAVRRVVLAGKSMGSRVGCHVSLEEHVDALVCFGYPLVGANGKSRDEVLLALRTPVLFLQGTRDPLCPLDRLAAVRAKMPARNQLHVVEGGNHSLEITRTQARESGIAQDEVDARVLRAVSEFLHGLTA